MRTVFSVLLLVSLASAAPYWKGHWASVSQTNKPHGRYAPNACFTDSGKLFVFGGREQGWEDFHNDTHLMSFSTSAASASWSEIDIAPGNPCPVERYGAATVQIGNKIYMYGGSAYVVDNGTETQQFYNEIWTFDLTTNQWAQVVPTNDMPEVRYDMGHLVHKGKLIVFGGRGDTSKEFESDMWSFDPSTSAWTQIVYSGTSQPEARAECHLHMLPSGDAFVLFGGRANHATEPNLDDMWQFNLTSRVWTQITPASGSPKPHARFQYHSAMRDGYLYIFAGTWMEMTPIGRKYHFLNDTWRFHVEQRTWAQIHHDAPIPARCDGVSFFVPQGQAATALVSGKQGGFAVWGGKTGWKKAEEVDFDDLWVMDLAKVRDNAAARLSLGLLGLVCLLLAL